MNDHPLLSELECLIEGGLEPDQEAAIRSHVAGCPLCSGIVEGIERRRSMEHEPTQRFDLNDSGSSDADSVFEAILLKNPPHRPNETPRTVFPEPPSVEAPLGSIDHYDIQKLLGEGSDGARILGNSVNLVRGAHGRRFRHKSGFPIRSLICSKVCSWKCSSKSFRI